MEDETAREMCRELQNIIAALIKRVNDLEDVVYGRGE